MTKTYTIKQNDIIWTHNISLKGAADLEIYVRD